MGSDIFVGAHLEAIEAIGAEIVGVHDVRADTARRIAAQRGWRACDDLDELLGLPADLAVVVAPHPFHADLTVACLHAGLHVVLEKPVAVSIDEADGIVETAAATGRVVAVVFQHRLRREVIEARRLVEEGEIGQLHRAEVVSYYPKRAVYYTGSPWQGSWRGAGGGVILNQGQHDLDLLTHVAGVQPSQIFAWESTLLHPIETEDTAEAVVRWASGATGSIHITSAAAGAPRRLELLGSAGSIQVLPGTLELTRNEVDMHDFAAAEGGRLDLLPRHAPVAFPGGGGTHAEVYADLVAALAEGRRPALALEGALDALELANAMTLSSELGLPVDLPLDRAAYRMLLDEKVHATPR